MTSHHDQTQIRTPDDARAPEPVGGPKTPSPPRYRIGVDVGGTFTDLVVAHAGGLHVSKVPSTVDDPARGVLDAVAAAATSLGVTEQALLGHSELFVHGSTVATNTVLEGAGAVVGLITTTGFRDSLEIRRGRRRDPWDHRSPFAEVLVPRHLRAPLPGRLDADGEEIEALELAPLEAVLTGFDAAGVEAIAICLFNAHANGAHENACAAAVRENRPGIWVSISHEIAPVIGEYERGATSVMNAYVAPRTVGYLQALAGALASRGLERPLLLVQNNGGSIPVDQVAIRPVTLLLSGPAAGVGALEVVRETTGSDALIGMEIGGTSCDVMLMEEGSVAVTDTMQVAGYDVAVPSIDIHTVGAGGGTIAHVDDAGMLRVGPRGAGARPGPAAYGLGGERPTVTDALLVVGRLPAATHGDGRVRLDPGLARSAIQRHIADPLGIDVEAAAVGVIRIMEQQLLQALEQVSFDRGVDPRTLKLVAAGGAGPMHGATVARRLGCREVYVSRLAGAFCALGMLNTDVRHDLMRSALLPLHTTSPEILDDLFRGLEQRAGAQLDAEGFDAARRTLERRVDARYVGQQWSLSVPAEDLDGIRETFENTHERRYRHAQPEGAIELTALRVVARGQLPRTLPPRGAGARRAAVPGSHRRAYIDEEAGFVRCAIHDGDALAPGHEVVGPAVVEERTTTICIGPGDRLEVDGRGGFHITLAPPGDAGGES